MVTNNSLKAPRFRRAMAVIALAAAAFVSVAAHAQPAAAAPDPSNVRYFAGQGWGGDRSLAERAAWDNAYGAAAAGGYAASSCVRSAGPQFDQIGTAWMALVEIKCVHTPRITVPQVPWTSSPALGYCIGGEHCLGVRLYLTVGSPTAKKQVNQVIVSAHDDMGGETNAMLGLFADGVQIGGWQDVRKAGSTHTFAPSRPVAELQLRSQSTDGRSEETIVNSISIR